MIHSQLLCVFRGGALRSGISVGQVLNGDKICLPSWPESLKRSRYQDTYTGLVAIALFTTARVTYVHAIDKHKVNNQLGPHCCRATVWAKGMGVNVSRNVTGVADYCNTSVTT